MRTHHAPHHTRRFRRSGGLGAHARRSVGAQATPAIPLNNGQETTGADGGRHRFFSYDIDGDQFCYTLEVDGLTTPAVAAHIHVGDRRTAGRVVIPLSVGTRTSFEASDCVTADPALLAAIEEDPGD